MGLAPEPRRKRDSRSGKQSIDYCGPKQSCPSDNCLNLPPVRPTWDVEPIVTNDDDELQRDQERE